MFASTGPFLGLVSGCEALSGSQRERRGETGREGCGQGLLGWEALALEGLGGPPCGYEPHSSPSSSFSIMH